MHTARSATPDVCPYCPHFDGFHASCRHPLRQDVVAALAERGGECPLFDEVRATAMRELADEFN